MEKIICQRRSKNLPDGGAKVGHCSGQLRAVTGGVKVVLSAQALVRI
jgi:hypothetical protein